MNFDFGGVLTRAWEIVWKHRVLWIFGILASCGRGGGASNGGGGGGSNGPGMDVPPQVERWAAWIAQNVVTFLVIVCLAAVVLWVIMLTVGSIGKIGLIRGTQQVERGAASLIFGQLFSEGMPYFGRMFGLSALLVLPVFLVGLFTAVLAVTALAASGGDAQTMFLSAAGMVPVLACCACLFVPLMIVLNLIFRQAERAAVLEDLGVLPALSRGWEVFRANLGSILLMAIMLWILAVVVGFVVALPVILAVVPAALAFALGNAQRNTPLLLAGVCFCLYLPVLILLNGILVAYVESAWTLTYMRLTRKPGEGGDLTPIEIPPASPEPDPNQTILSGSHA